jgi:ABC-2 type transport system permease protein/oleandomycin transport system permease protein
MEAAEMTEMVANLKTEARWIVPDTMTMAWRNLVVTTRTPELLTFVTIQPIMFVLLFVYVFGGAIQTGGNYVDFLIPGIIIQTVLFGTGQTGVGLAWDLKLGIVDRYRSLPMARSAVIGGRVLGDMVRNLFVVGVMLGVGLAVGFRFHGGETGAIALPFFAIGFSVPFHLMMAYFGARSTSAESANVASFLIIFPVTFLSSAFVPVETMPDWLQPVANGNPMTSGVNAARALAQGGALAKDLWITLAWIVGLSAFFAPLAVYQYRKAS